MLHVQGGVFGDLSHVQALAQQQQLEPLACLTVNTAAVEVRLRAALAGQAAMPCACPFMAHGRACSAACCV